MRIFHFRKVVSLVNLLKCWFHGKFWNFLSKNRESKFVKLSHCERVRVNFTLHWEKIRNLLSPKKSSNQLFSNCYSKYVGFTNFLSKYVEWEWISVFSTLWLRYDVFQCHVIQKKSCKQKTMLFSTKIRWFHKIFAKKIPQFYMKYVCKSFSNNRWFDGIFCVQKIKSWVKLYCRLLSK